MHRTRRRFLVPKIALFCAVFFVFYLFFESKLLPRYYNYKFLDIIGTISSTSLELYPRYRCNYYLDVVGATTSMSFQRHRGCNSCYYEVENLIHKEKQ